MKEYKHHQLYSRIIILEKITKKKNYIYIDTHTLNILYLICGGVKYGPMI